MPNLLEAFTNLTEEEKKLSIDVLIKAGKLTKEQVKARFVSILDRGITNDRYAVPLPPDVHGEWALNKAQDIDRMKSMGFEIDLTYATDRALHNDGTGNPIVGDTIFMTQPMWLHEVYEETRKKKYAEMHGSLKKNKNLAEEVPGTDLPVVNSSVSEVVNSTQIATSLQT